jgi:sialidase-1
VILKDCASRLIIGFTERSSPERVRLLFSNPAGSKRERMTVRLSNDGGKTWPKARVLHAGPSTYSCLTVLPNQTLACLYERGERNSYERITFVRFGLDWLVGGD